jgi:hypothetical protein
MKDTDVFDGKKLSDILKDIHDNALGKRQNINSVITQLTGMIKSPDDAVMLVPLIKEFYDVGIKNDEHVVKVATIAQRLISAESYADGSDGNLILSDAEKERLLTNAMAEFNAHVAEVDDTLQEVKSKVHGL